MLLGQERRPRRRNFFHRWILQSDGLGCSREILPNQLLLFTVHLLPALSPARIRLLSLLVRIWANEYILNFPSLPMSRYFFAPADPSVKKKKKQKKQLLPLFSLILRRPQGRRRRRRAPAPRRGLPPSLYQISKTIKNIYFSGKKTLCLYPHATFTC